MFTDCAYTNTPHVSSMWCVYVSVCAVPFTCRIIPPGPPSPASHFLSAARERRVMCPSQWQVCQSNACFNLTLIIALMRLRPF